jgi:hypothetical protein
MTSEKGTVAQHAELAMREIRECIADGVIPADRVTSFSDLHDFIDANTLGGICADGFPESFGTDQAGHDAWMTFGNDVFDIVDAWIKNGGIAGKAV